MQRNTRYKVQHIRLKLSAFVIFRLFCCYTVAASQVGNSLSHDVTSAAFHHDGRGSGRSVIDDIEFPMAILAYFFFLVAL